MGSRRRNGSGGRGERPVRRKLVRVRPVTLRMLREGIGTALRDALNADAVEEFCAGIGLAPPEPPNDVAYSSRQYVLTVRPNSLG
jgi:hypothetical protein